MAALALPQQPVMRTIKFKDEPTLVAIVAILLAIAALWAVSCGGGGGGGSYSPAPTAPSTSTGSGGSGSTGSTANVTVNIVGSAGAAAFSPNPASAAAGQTVGFKNNDSTVHHLVADNGSWDAGDIAPGATKTVSVTSAAAVNFHCTIHPTMVGSINGATAPPDPTPNPSGGYDY
jgi:plastocyanin